MFNRCGETTMLCFLFIYINIVGWVILCCSSFIWNTRFIIIPTRSQMQHLYSVSATMHYNVATNGRQFWRGFFCIIFERKKNVNSHSNPSYMVNWMETDNSQLIKILWPQVQLQLQTSTLCCKDSTYSNGYTQTCLSSNMLGMKNSTQIEHGV